MRDVTATLIYEDERPWVDQGDQAFLDKMKSQIDQTRAQYSANAQELPGMPPPAPSTLDKIGYAFQTVGQAFTGYTKAQTELETQLAQRQREQQAQLALLQQQGYQTTDYTWVWWLLGAGALGGAAYYMYRKNKRRRR